MELGEICEDETTKLEIKDQVKRMQGYLNALSEVFDLKNADAVYWMERTGKKIKLSIFEVPPLRWLRFYMMNYSKDSPQSL